MKVMCLLLYYSWRSFTTTF